MPIDFTQLAADPDTTNATSHATPSISPTANRLLLTAVLSSRGSSTNPVTPTLSGNGLTWALVDATEGNQAFPASGTLRYRLCLFAALTGASPSAGAVTADHGGVTHTGCAIIVAQSDEEVDLADAIVQVDGVNPGFVTSATASMAAFADAGNAAFSCWALDTTATVTHEGTELADITYSTPAARLQAQYLGSQDTTPGVSWTGSANAAGIAVEVRIAGAGPTTHFGASSLTVSVNVASSGFKKTFGASTQTLAFGFGSAGVARKFGASSQTLTLGFASAGHAKKFGASSLPVVFTFDSNGVIVPPGPVTHFGSSTLHLAVNIASAGLRTTFGSSSQTFAFAFASAAFKTTFGSSTLPIVFAFDTDGIVRGKVFASSSLTLTLATESSARLKAFASSSLPIVFTFTSNGTASGPAPDVVPATVTIQNAEQTAMTATVLTGAVVSLLDATGIMVVVADEAEAALNTETLTGASVSVIDRVP